MSRINTNVQSILARRVLGANQTSLNSALTRLSTGLRINTGKDDPAGLIASETLRSSKVAITSAIDNANRADSIVSVAEGGLQETGTLLLELESLIEKSANESGLSSAEIKANQLQIDSILQSINRISDQTAFGDKRLLNGNFDYITSGVNINESTGATLDHLDNVRVNAARIPEGSYKGVTVQVVNGSTYGYVSAIGGGYQGRLSSAVTIQVRGTLGSEVFSFASGTTQATIVTAINSVSQLTGVSAIVSAVGSGPDGVIFASMTYGSDGFVSVERIDSGLTSAMNIHGAKTANRSGADGTVTVNGSTATVKGLDVSLRTSSLSVELTLSNTFGSTDGGSTSFEVTGGGATFAIAPDVGLAGIESLGITEVSTSTLGSGVSTIGYLASLGSGQANDLNAKNFAQAQRIVKEAISQVASLRGRLGAFQRNTIQTTINSLSVAFENITAAESVIRDADFAVETSNLTRSQILVNSATATLQLANASPQTALQLLG